MQGRDTPVPAQPRVVKRAPLRRHRATVAVREQGPPVPRSRSCVWRGRHANREISEEPNVMKGAAEAVDALRRGPPRSALGPPRSPMGVKLRRWQISASGPPSSPVGEPDCLARRLRRRYILCAGGARDGHRGGFSQLESGTTASLPPRSDLVSVRISST